MVRFSSRALQLEGAKYLFEGFEDFEAGALQIMNIQFYERAKINCFYE